MRLLAIGDVHGCYRALETLAREVDFQPDDRVIAIGDYMDRGPQSREVIDFFVTLGQTTEVHCLRGNHEVMMLQARHDPAAYRDWLASGGSTTLDSYQATGLSGIPDAHWDFLAGTRPYLELDREFFVHANASPGLPLAEQPERMLYWEKFRSPPPHQSGKRMICGHTPQKNGRPLNIGHAVCIDTWVYAAGWLTCLDVNSGVYWQANQRGQTFRDTLGEEQHPSDHLI